MMKKLVFCSLLASTLLSAADYNYEISPMAGNVFSYAQEIENHRVYGAELQYNDVPSVVKPEFLLLYSNAGYYQGAGDTNIFRTALNGVYNLNTSNNITPLIKAGLGYETMSNHQLDNHNSLFGDVGAGVKVALAKQIALKLEAIHMLKFNHFNWDNNLLFMAGLNFAFDEKAAPIVTPVVAPAPKPVVIPAPAPKPVVIPAPAPKPVAIPAPAPKPVAIPAPAPKPVAIPAPTDSDKDGVFDAQDQCQATPAGFKVDADGCPVKATLHLNFTADSNEVDIKGTAKVAAFALFLKESPAYKVRIIGHTDSTASDKYNQKLSEKRAEIVKSMLIKEGIEESRLSASGKGESQPIATNATKQGRAENRRIEVELFH